MKKLERAGFDSVTVGVFIGSEQPSTQVRCLGRKKKLPPRLPSRDGPVLELEHCHLPQIEGKISLRGNLVYDIPRPKSLLQVF
jgi:hypothetical protein